MDIQLCIRNTREKAKVTKYVRIDATKQLKYWRDLPRMIK